jgi:hypothetical protein
MHLSYCAGCLYEIGKEENAVEDEQRNQNQTDAQGKPPRSANVKKKQTKKPDESKDTSNGPKAEKKKSWRKSWRSASPLKKAEIIGLGIAAFAGLGYLVAFICVSVSQNRISTLEHRPHVIISRPPALQQFGCEVTGDEIHLFFGPMRTWLKNIGHGDAVGVFIEDVDTRLIPEHKTGVPFFDALPPITERTCNQQISPNVKAFPINVGQEVYIDSPDGAGNIRLGSGPTRVNITEESVVQLYAPACADYFDSSGQGYRSCRTYRFRVRFDQSADPYGFSCAGTPIEGVFEQMWFSYCDN